ncbi:hypothetical protein ABPG75_010735 [Micractinium tetrahymenae]
MFGGRGRGRGRDRGGDSGGRSGPRLPVKLTKELFGEAAGGGRGRGRSLPRKERRRAEREGRKGGAGGRGRGERQRQQHERQQSGGRAGKGGRSGDAPAAKRQRLSGPPGIGKGSKFGELLPAHLQAAGGHDPEKELQRQLASRLGLKKGKTKMGGDDGLDEFLEELGGIDDLFGSDSEGQAAGGAGKKRKQPATGGLGSAGSSSDEDLASEGGEEEEEEDGFSAGEEDGLDGLLGSGDSEGEEDGEQDSDEEEEQEEQGSEGDEDEEQGGSSGDDSLIAGLDAEEEEEEEDDAELLGSEEEDGEAEEDGEGSSSSGDDEAEQQQAQQQPAAVGRYVPPAARRAAEAAAGGGGSEAAARVERRVRGLLNRLAEANIQGIVSDLAALYQAEGRRLVSDAVCAELIAAAAEGPRASDRFAAVTAAAVAGLAGSVRAAEVLANFLSRLGARLEAAAGGGDTLCCHNLAMVAAHLYLAGALRPDLVFSMLGSWRERFTETDVGMIVELLHACGLQLRAADPVAMREFVVAVHARAGEAGGAGQLTKRAQILLELVVDVKNNRRREDAKRRVVELAPAVTRWLKASGAADVAIGGIAWSKVLQPNKKGIWWMPEAADAQPAQLGSGAALRAAAAAAAAGAGGEGGLAGPELLKLAASLRMNTDVRRAVFCVVMGSEDCVDAVERLLRLGLKGEQEREVVRVTVECCLQEKAWNAYYAHLLIRLCTAGKSHKMTLQFCLWDQLKELGGMDVRRLTNLARLLATVLAGLALPSTMLKVVDFGAAMPARETLFWRVFFEHLLASCKSAADSTSLFQRIAAQPELKSLRSALGAFLQRSVGPWLAAKEPGAGGLTAEQLGELLRRLRGAEKVLAGAA